MLYPTFGAFWSQNPNFNSVLTKNVPETPIFVPKQVICVLTNRTKGASFSTYLQSCHV